MCIRDSSQPCQPAGSVDPEELELLNGDLNASGSLINDGRRQQVQASYRLRSYTSNGNTGTVEIEGYASSEQGQTVLSRSLLTRMLALEEAVIEPTHWGVLAARQLTLGSSSLSGPGVALWLMDRNEASSHFNSSSSCSNAALAAATGSSDPTMQAALWPRAGDGDLFPPCLLYTSPSPRDGLLSRMPSSA